MAGAENSVYVGTDGLSCGTLFSVTNTGSLMVRDALFIGGIYGTWYLPLPSAAANKTLAILFETQAYDEPGNLTINSDGTAFVSYSHPTGIVVPQTRFKTYTYYNDRAHFGGGAIFDNNVEFTHAVAFDAGLYSSGTSVINTLFTTTLKSTTINTANLNVGGYSNANYHFCTADFICNSWVRTVGATGWYNETYGGGWFMRDSRLIS